MFTKQQVLEILKEIDEDNTKTIDFFECLQVSQWWRWSRNFEYDWYVSYT